MNIKLYTNYSNSNVVDKDLSWRVDLTAQLKEETSVTDPVLILGGIDEYIANVNYVYIQELSRYYFVTEVISLKNGLWEIHCHVDVLYTYKDTIRLNSAIVARQQNNFNTMLSDPRLKVEAEPYVQTTFFTNGFESGWTYCLAVAGN